MEEAYQIIDYLPCSFKTPNEQDYISFLWDAFQSNYDNKKYQFAFLAYHMLYMSFVYFNVWQIKQNLPDDFEKALIGFNKDVENGLLNATSPFTFSEVNESGVLRFLKLIGCDNGRIGNYTKLVKDRNDIAHPNGNIFFKAQESLDAKISETLRHIDEIQQHSRTIVESCFRKFLLENHNIEEREYTEDSDQIREILIHKNYLSQKDIGFCLKFDINSLSGESNYSAINGLFESFRNEYGEE